MSNYTKSINFTAKDSLPTGDANKVIRGSEFDTEFDAIQTAVGTKADLAGPTFTGTITLPTVDINAGAIDGTTIGGSSAAAGTFTNLVATSADINGGTLDGATIGGSSAGAGTFTNLTASGTVNFNGATVSNLGTITTANLDGGTADNIVIGGATPAAGTFTTLAATSATVGGAAVLTSVTFSDLDAGAVTTSSETFANSDTQIPTNAAVKAHVEAVIPTLTVTEASVTAHQAALAITASQLSDVTSTAAELNILDGVTATAAELNILDGVTSTAAELNILDGVTSTAAELNILDGVTSTAAELNILDGVTATAAELNILDGVTATTAELNYVDGVTSNIQTQINSINPSPTLDATASGTLANGDTIIVNTNGTVSAVAGSTVTQAVGSATVFESASVNYPAIAYDSNAQKVLIAYRDQGNSNQGTAVVGTVSGTSISFGTPAVFNTYGVTHVGIAYDSNAQKFVIAYTTGDSNLGTGIVATVSGTSVTFGSETTFDSEGSTTLSRVAYDENAQKVVIAYKDGYNNKGSAVVGTVSGTSISFGTKVVFDASNVGGISIAYDPDSQKVVIAYADLGSSNFGTSIVGTVSGTSISFGTAVVFESAAILSTAISYDTINNKIVISYADNANSNHGTCIVGTVSGTSISYGTAVVFEAAGINADISSSFHTAAGKVVIAYADVGNSTFGTVIVGTVSGTSISFETAAVFESANTGDILTAYDANAEKVVITYKDNGNSVYGTAVVFQAAFTSTNLTAENYIGISNAAYSDSATATIQIVGSVDDAQSSLTPGQKYFVQTDGSLGTTADDPEVFAGTAVSATKLIVKG
jgi:hypothetical protein